MFELKSISERTLKRKTKQGGIITTTKWTARFKETDDEDEGPKLNASIDFDQEPTHLKIGSLYKLNLEE